MDKSQKEKREGVGLKEYFEEIMAENFSNMVKVKNPQIQEAKQTSKRINLKTKQNNKTTKTNELMNSPNLMQASFSDPTGNDHALTWPTFLLNCTA